MPGSLRHRTTVPCQVPTIEASRWAHARRRPSRTRRLLARIAPQDPAAAVHNDLGIEPPPLASRNQQQVHLWPHRELSHLPLVVLAPAPQPSIYGGFHPNSISHRPSSTPPFHHHAPPSPTPDNWADQNASRSHSSMLSSSSSRCRCALGSSAVSTRTTMSDPVRRHPPRPPNRHHPHPQDPGH